MNSGVERRNNSGWKVVDRQRCCAANGGSRSRREDAVMNSGGSRSREREIDVNNVGSLSWVAFCELLKRRSRLW